MKRLFYTCLISAFSCSAIVAWFSPQIISWYFTPPADLVISCRPAVEWGIDSYRKLVLIGAFAGLFIGATIHFVLRKKNSAVAV